MIFPFIGDLPPTQEKLKPAIIKEADPTSRDRTDTLLTLILNPNLSTEQIKNNLNEFELKWKKAVAKNPDGFKNFVFGEPQPTQGKQDKPAIIYVHQGNKPGNTSPDARRKFKNNYDSLNINPSLELDINPNLSVEEIYDVLIQNRSEYRRLKNLLDEKKELGNKIEDNIKNNISPEKYKHTDSAINAIEKARLANNIYLLDISFGYYVNLYLLKIRKVEEDKIRKLFDM